jgi:hypothetical protein
MPAFTAPAGYASVGTTGYGATFSTGSPLTAMLEIKTINGDYIDQEVVDFTHLLSPSATKEKRGGMIEPGTVDIGGNFIGDTTQLAIVPAMVASAEGTAPTFAWQIKAGVQNNTKTYTVTGTGFYKKYKNGAFEGGKPVEFSLTLQITGIISETVA